MSKFYPAIELIGGGAGALDKIDGTLLANGDTAFVSLIDDAIYGTTTFSYALDASSAAVESVPQVIAPDTNAGDKRWVISGVYKSGTAEMVTVTPSTADQTNYILFADGTTGAQGVEAAAGLTYNPSTGVLTTPGGYDSGATADPGATFKDSDAPGADKVIAEITAQYVDGADGAENASVTVSAQKAGTMTAVLMYDPTLDYVYSAKPRCVVVTTASTLSAAQVSDTLVTNYAMAAGRITTLPDLSVRAKFTIFVETRHNDWDWEIEPPTGEAFVLDGVALAANQHIILGDVLGDSALLMRIRTGAETYAWHVFTVVGIHAGVV